MIFGRTLLACLLLSIGSPGCGGDSEEETIDDTTTGYEDPPPPPPPEPVAEPEPPPPPPEPEPPPPPPRLTFEEEWADLSPAPMARWTTCESDDQCAIAEIGCCDHCNGGRVVSVNSRFTTQATRRYRPRRCEEACTEMGCAQATPVCDVPPAAEGEEPAPGRCTFIANWMTGGPPAGSTEEGP